MECPVSTLGLDRPSGHCSWTAGLESEDSDTDSQQSVQSSKSCCLSVPSSTTDQVMGCLSLIAAKHCYQNDLLNGLKLDLGVTFYCSA